MREVPDNISSKIENELPEFVKAVKSKSADNITMMLDAFAGEPVLFYEAVWYATSNGKHVHIVSGKQTGNGVTTSPAKKKK